MKKNEVKGKSGVEGGITAHLPSAPLEKGEVVENKPKSTPKEVPQVKVQGPKPKAIVLVACPNNSGNRNEYCVNAMFSMGWFAAANGIQAAAYTFDEHPISVARNAAMDMLERNAHFTHVFFIDSDVVPPPDIIARLVSYDVPVVSGWYLNRKGTGVPLIFKLEDKSFSASMPLMQHNPKEFPSFKPYQLQELLTLPKDKKTGLCQVDGIAMGCVLIKREVLAKAIAKNDSKTPIDFKAKVQDSPTLSKPYFFEDPINFHGFGEDLWFSLNCKLHNIPIYLDQSAFCAHVTWGLIDMRHVQALLRRSQMQLQQIPQAAKKSPM